MSKNESANSKPSTSDEASSNSLVYTWVKVASSVTLRYGIDVLDLDEEMRTAIKQELLRRGVLEQAHRV